MPAVGVNQIMTVTGPIDPSELGMTLLHEHLYINQGGASRRRNDDLIDEEMSRFKAEGGRSIVELTLPGIGDPEERLKAISERTGVQIVTGSGWYRNPVNRLPDSRMDPDREDNMVEYLIDEIDDYWSGDPNPGVIGVDRLSVSRREYWVLRVSARAQVATGLCLNTPAIRDRGLAQLDILTEEGVDLSRVVIGYGHDDSYPPLNYYLEIMDTGATVAFDNIGHPRMHESRVLGVLLGLLERGYREQVVLSQDLCYDDSLAADGYTDYAYLQREFIPKLLEAGVGEKAIHAMTVENPRRLLTRTM